MPKSKLSRPDLAKLQSELEADRRRLDWLEKKCTYTSLETQSRVEFYYHSSKTIRQAIDATMTVKRVPSA